MAKINPMDKADIQKAINDYTDKTSLIAFFLLCNDTHQDIDNGMPARNCICLDTQIALVYDDCIVFAQYTDIASIIDTGKDDGDDMAACHIDCVRYTIATHKAAINTDTPLIIVNSQGPYYDKLHMDGDKIQLSQALDGDCATLPLGQYDIWQDSNGNIRIDSKA